MHAHMRGRILEEFGFGALGGKGTCMHMKVHVLNEFGSGARGARGTCKGTSWRNLALEPATPGAHAGAYEGAHPGEIWLWRQRGQGQMQAHMKGGHPGGIWLRSPRSQVHMQGQMKDYILEEFGSGASEPRGACRGT